MTGILNTPAPTIRAPTVAGTFYPADAEILAADLNRLLGGDLPSSGPFPKAIIAPHAGYIYSGACAAAAYRYLAPARGIVRRVVLIGPCHRLAVQGMATTGADVWRTPLGDIPVDRAALDRVVGRFGVGILDAAHAQEHSLEVHLPFLQTLLGDFTLLPFAAGAAEAVQVAALLETLWGGTETLIVISTDLSHYLDESAARTMDAGTAAAVERLDWRAIGREQACGRTPLSGLLELARRRGMTIRRAQLSTSADSIGPRDRVVGYGAWILHEHDAAAETATLSEAAKSTDNLADDTAHIVARHGAELRALARHVVDRGLQAGEPHRPDPARYAPVLNRPGAAFVTLTRGGRLRGCIGSLLARRSLLSDVAENAWGAAFRDPRFPPLQAGEREGLEVSVTLLCPPRPLAVSDEAELIRRLRPGRDGLILECGERRATFLPQVWDTLPHARDFVARLKQKAGLAADFWSPELRILRYDAHTIG